MENNEQNKEKLLDYLELIRDNQALKSPDEINRELLDGTVSMLLKLQNKKIDLSIEEVKERVRKIPFVKIPDFEKEAQKKRKKINKRKILLIAAIIAILCTLLIVMSSGRFVDYWHSVMNEKFGSVFNVPIGEEYNEGNEEAGNLGKPIIYTTTDEFYAKENYDVLLPKKLPGNIEFINIHIIESDNVITASFDTIITSYDIYLNTTIPQIITENLNVTILANNISCYIDRFDDIKTVQIYFEHNGNYYSISGTDEQILLNIIENLEE